MLDVILLTRFSKCNTLNSVSTREIENGAFTVNFLLVLMTGRCFQGFYFESCSVGIGNFANFIQKCSYNKKSPNRRASCKKMFVCFMCAEIQQVVMKKLHPIFLFLFIRFTHLVSV